MEPMVLGILTRRAGSVFVGGAPGRELLHARGRIDRMVLPVPVAADENQVALGFVVRLDPAAERIPLVGVGGVGMVVHLLLAIGADRWRRAGRCVFGK